MSYACNVNSLSNLLEVDKNDFGVKSELDSQLKGLNEKFNKKNRNGRNGIVITRYENQEILGVDGFA